MDHNITNPKPIRSASTVYVSEDTLQAIREITAAPENMSTSVRIHNRADAHRGITVALNAEQSPTWSKAPTVTMTGHQLKEALCLINPDGDAQLAPAWSTNPPTDQDWYWHWTGHWDQAPFPVSVMYSGTANKCFVAMTSTHSGKAERCDEYGGYWLRIQQPSTAPIDNTMSQASPPTTNTL